MRKILLLTLFFLISNTLFAITKVYIPKNGKYVLSGYKYTGSSSINSCLNYLGYRKGTFYDWMTPDESIIVCFKILSTDIICIISDYDLGTEISKEKVSRLLNDNGFDYSKKYGAYFVEDDLESGIKGKYLTLSFIEKATHVKAVNNKITDNLNGYEYTFKNGIMVSYKSLDGYNKWAKEYMGEWWFSKLKEKAETKFSNKKDIVAYINKQCDYCADVGFNWLTERKIKQYDYNFGLLCIHYNYNDLYNDDKRIFSLSEFNRIVENEAINISPNSNYSPVMIYNRYKYTFNFKDELSKIESARERDLELADSINYIKAKQYLEIHNDGNETSSEKEKYINIIKEYEAGIKALEEARRTQDYTNIDLSRGTVGISSSVSVGSRSVVSLPKPQYSDTTSEGTVVVVVVVNSKGAVISAVVSSSNTSASLQNSALAAARKTRFSESDNNAEKGTITYRFKQNR